MTVDADPCASAATAELAPLVFFNMGIVAGDTDDLPLPVERQFLPECRRLPGFDGHRVIERTRMQRRFMAPQTENIGFGH